jgi:hypothetical protein
VDEDKEERGRRCRQDYECYLIVRNIASCRLVLCGKSRVAVACLVRHSSNGQFPSSQAHVLLLHHITSSCNAIPIQGSTWICNCRQGCCAYLCLQADRLRTLETLALMGLHLDPRAAGFVPAATCAVLTQASRRAEDAQTTLSHPRHHPSSTSLRLHHVLPSLPSHYCLSLGKKLRPERAQGKESARREIAP